MGFRDPFRMTHSSKPRIGVPWRTASEEGAGKRVKYDFYLRAVAAAGGEPVEISLQPAAFERERVEEAARTLDGFVMPGSPADVNPEWYHGRRHAQTAPPDPQREQTDFAIYDVAFAGHKPVLAICYGCQSLNVWLGGNLFQHIPEEIPNALVHSKPGDYNVFHPVTIEPDSRLARIAECSGGFKARVNTSHHQSVLRAGRGLRIVARATDGVVEAIEYTGDAHWLLGVQWHPEVMVDDALAQALFRELVVAASKSLAVQVKA
jgi:putative glutamine amidotransferase